MSSTFKVSSCPMTSCHSVAMHFSLVVTWCVVAMASESLEDIFTRCGVDSSLCNNLMMEGWSANSFRMAAVDLQGFEDVLTEWHCLRAAFESLRPPPTSSSNLDTTPSTGLSMRPDLGRKPFLRNWSVQCCFQ